MTISNVAAHNFTIVQSGDGGYYSAYPAGDKPGTYPIILYTDFYAGPTTGGDGNNGCFLTLYGYNFGVFSDYGTSNHVTIGGVEVANYRCLTAAVDSGTSTIGRGVSSTFGIQCLTVQVGALGSPTAGTPIKIDMTIHGVHPGNAQDGSGNYLAYVVAYDGTRQSLMFTPQPGTIYFRSNSGSDSNNGLTPSTPLLTLQGSTGFTGIFLCATAGSGAGASAGMKPGTHVYDMGGGTINAQGNQGFAVNLFRIGGTLPNGSANRGPICYTRYPGAAGANSPATVFIQGATLSGAGGGGFNGPDTARAAETNPYDGLTGWGRSIHVSNIKIISAVDGERDGCPFNLQSGMDDCRVVNCDFSWPWTHNGSGVTNTGAIAGNGLGVQLLGDWLHDINGVLADNQNHGIYLDGSVHCAKNCTIAWCVIYNIAAGNGIQTFNGQAADTITNISVHNNWVEKTNKHGLNLGAGTASRIDFNNVVVDSGEASYNNSSPDDTGTNALKSYSNVFYGWGLVANTRTGYWNQSGIGNIDSRNNVFAQKAGVTAGGFVGTNGATDNFSHDVWFDYGGTLTTKPSNDSTGTYHDPGFVAPTTHNFQLSTGSTCIDFGTSPLITRAFDFLGNNVSGTPDAGAYEFGAHL